MNRRFSVAALVSSAVLVFTPLPSSAEASDERGLAWFEGRQIDLAQGWGDAQACLIWRAAGVAECFASAEGMTLRELELKTTLSAQTLSYSCSSPLRLYEHTWYGGRQLSFWDPGYWQNLGDYGFNDQLSSYQIGSCYAHLAEHAWGGGWWYPGNTSPYHWEPVMWSGWNDRVSSIYNE